MIRGMVKFAGSSLISSFTPFDSVLLKKHRRFSVNSFFKNSNNPRSLSTCTQNIILHTKAEMVASQYLPPWFSVAPMMDWTDNHYRTLARLISKHAWLYTEMLAAETIIYQQGNLAFVFL
ncbi:hypothetical protein CUMW_026000 [Citrus unshiu]|nr:hypothetical protein CUMW_026000 [Citrus unshiu]GAY37017.1 hypothetical protein CUMW_026000 [Citrus unshiu]